MARSTGWSYEFVTLQQHPEYRNLWGYVQYSRPLETREDLNLWAPTFLAGQFGEVVLLGFAGPGGSQDNAMVMEQVRAFVGAGDEGRTFFQHAFQQAQQNVQQYANEVRLVAEALLQQDRLTRADIDRVLNNSAC